MKMLSKRNFASNFLCFPLKDETKTGMGKTTNLAAARNEWHRLRTITTNLRTKDRDLTSFDGLAWHRIMRRTVKLICGILKIQSDFPTLILLSCFFSSSFSSSSSSWATVLTPNYSVTGFYQWRRHRRMPISYRGYWKKIRKSSDDLSAKGFS